MSIKKDLSELINADIINSLTASKIQKYYQDKSHNLAGTNFIIFGILGASLVALGIILIIAHNWDNISRQLKTILAFLPLVIGQALCTYLFFSQKLSEKKISNTWIESASTFLFLAIGANLSLVSQVYNTIGDLNKFLLIWLALALPLTYLMRSSMASLLALILLIGTFYNNDYYPIKCLFLLSIIPYYIYLCKQHATGNFTKIFHWIIPIASFIVVFNLPHTNDKYLKKSFFITYLSIFNIYFLVGNLNYFKRQKLTNNGYKILGIVGSINLLLFLSGLKFWEVLNHLGFEWSYLFATPRFMTSTILSIITLGLLISKIKNKGLKNIQLLDLTFILFIPTFILGHFTPLVVIGINAFIFIMGLIWIKRGIKQNRLAIVNLGLLIITSLIINRFFDTDVPYIIKGTTFVLLGLGFFIANFYLLKKEIK